MRKRDAYLYRKPAAARRALWAASQARYRARRKIREAATATHAQQREERRVWLNSSGLVAMRLLEDLTIHLELGGGFDLTLPATTEAWVAPGVVVDLERRGLAQEIQQKPTRYGAAVLTGDLSELAAPARREEPKIRTAAGY